MHCCRLSPSLLSPSAAAAAAAAGGSFTAAASLPCVEWSAYLVWLLLLLLLLQLLLLLLLLLPSVRAPPGFRRISTCRRSLNRGGPGDPRQQQRSRAAARCSLRV